jgi:DNA-binding NarL/FixJ family response regulator
MQIRLLVACVEEHVARALCTKIAWADGRIAGESSTLAEARERAASSTPDVVLLEYVPEQEESAWQVLARFAQDGATRVLLACQSYSDSDIISFIQRGASGCLLTSSSPLLYAKAACAVQQGESWYPRAELLRALRSQLPADPGDSWDVLQDEELLTAREREILALVGTAMSNKEIARQLKISDLTVKTHLHHIYVKLQRSGRYKAFMSNGALAPGISVAAPRRPRSDRLAGN